MKGIARLAIVAAVAAGVSAQPHKHQHQHLHRQVKQRGEVEKRDTVVVTEVVEGPTITEYILGGQKVEEDDAKDGLKKGKYVIIGTSTPSWSAPPPAFSTSTSTSSPTGGQFFEHKPSSAPPAPAASSAAPATPSPPPSPGAGINADFPSGKVPCSQVPTDYGAIPVPWLAESDGWTTLMQVGKYVKGMSFNNIVQPKGTGCTPGCMCSYACPPGYQKTQWDEDSQGATGQSVGGLYCNQDGFLELTRPSHPKLCEQGAGGVFVRNELSSNAPVCRTDYPGNEAMTIPLDTQPGQTYPLTNPNSANYYKWQGKPTTAQYYANNEGVPVQKGCDWGSPSDPTVGNWAPTNIGVGQDDSGTTYLSIFPNRPTSNAVLNYNIELEGNFNGECWLRNGQYTLPNGCTVGIPKGGSVTLVFKH
ncbi:hypothetical protein QBC47DRAFT_358921 [Echria macrotheca]|uniref:Uncharacterized protein n=1 Tax=Echria macrotheca TaxID=438768 RepID=A0AAJ0BG68_9PEZI|nr:hypothetical protein QBC47DRAFT_358921 [Echria macrotheca]